MNFHALSLLKKLALVLALVAVAWVSIPTLLIGAMVGRASWGHWRRCRGHTRFDSRAWRDQALVRSPAAVRECMVNDLLARHSFRGQPRAAVVTLLGEPGPTDYFRDYDLVYWLGPERSLISIDSEWLVMKFDRAGRVAVARLVTD